LNKIHASLRSDYPFVRPFFVFLSSLFFFLTFSSCSAALSIVACAASLIFRSLLLVL
jgi:hypothetical protein